VDCQFYDAAPYIRRIFVATKSTYAMAPTETMNAIVISRPGGPEVLERRTLPRPRPALGEVLIRIHATGLNRSDIYSRKGSYGPMAGPQGAEIPGLEVAGTIVETGGARPEDARETMETGRPEDAREIMETGRPEDAPATGGAGRWKQGDRVCALVAGGGYAEYICVDERICLPIPAHLTFEEAASLPETIFTVWFNVFRQAALQPGEHFLVHGGSSGIGVMAIQMVTAWGAKAYTTAGSEEKCRFCLELGAVKAIHYKTQDFETALAADGMDVILDMIGGDYTPKNLRLLRNKGRLAFINAMQHPQTQINVAEIMRKNLVITGSMLKPQSLDVKALLASEIETQIWPRILPGQIRPVIHQVFPLMEAAAAQQLMESSDHIGKIILAVTPL